MQERQGAATAEQCGDLVSALPLNRTQMSATDSSMPLTPSTPLRRTHMNTHQPRKRDGFSTTASADFGPNQTRNQQQFYDLEVVTF